MNHEHYYHATDLPRFPEIGQGAPELWEKFLAWYGAVFAEGALTAREKALIALAVAHAVQCPYCIDAYTTAALEKGSNDGADDRGGARRRGDPRRRVAGARRADAEPSRAAGHVVSVLADAPEAAPSRSPSGAAQRRAPRAHRCCSAGFEEALDAAGPLPAARPPASKCCRSTSARSAIRPATTVTSTPAPTGPRSCRLRSSTRVSASSRRAASRRSTSPAARPSCTPTSVG